MAGPVTPPRGFAAVPEEFHPISVATTAYTEVSCSGCDYRRRTGAADVTHGADHAIATGHTVTETHIRVTVITGHPA